MFKEHDFLIIYFLCISPSIISEIFHLYTIIQVYHCTIDTVLLLLQPNKTKESIFDKCSQFPQNYFQYLVMISAGLKLSHDQTDKIPRTQFCYVYIEQWCGGTNQSVKELSLYLSQAYFQIRPLRCEGERCYRHFCIFSISFSYVPVDLTS